MRVNLKASNIRGWHFFGTLWRHRCYSYRGTRPEIFGGKQFYCSMSCDLALLSFLCCPYDWLQKKSCAFRFQPNAIWNETKTYCDLLTWFAARCFKNAEGSQRFIVTLIRHAFWSFSDLLLVGPVSSWKSYDTLKRFFDKSRSNFKKKNEKKKEILLVYWRNDPICDGREILSSCK